ncbi:MAG: hypothetical protein C5B60_08115 [Chloroflexi bacterium]|nr:MAG: hypothetical protein C5B60_08115 [Chloroflexota bacterium]
MNDPKKMSPYTARPRGADGKADEPSLLVLALLEQLHTDRAHGLHYDLSDYYAANPELEDEFLALALAADRDGERDDPVASSTEEAAENISGRRPLSPGVLRALARIPEISPYVDRREEEHNRVAESRAPYSADEDE